MGKEARKEARRASSSGNLNNNMRRQSSAGDIHKIHRRLTQPSVDADGFTEVSGKPAPGNFGRSQSFAGFSRKTSFSDYNNTSGNNSRRQDQSKRSSLGGSFSALNESRTTQNKSSTKKENKEKKVVETPKIEYLSPSDCGTKAQNILKEYFVGGDTDDAVLSFKELIGVGAEGSVDRGAKVVESSILLVLEMKQDDIDKFLVVVSRTFKENEIESASILAGLNDPLEFLQDIAIDAPLAAGHMITIVSELLKLKCISFEFLLNAPEYFRQDYGAASFACKVLKKLGGDALESPDNLEVVEKLMTEDDRGSFPTVQELLNAQ